MKYDIILAGVGGQGILTIAFVLDNSALEKGYQFKQAEVHGMAQRGGAVQSHLRISDGEIYSDLVPQGGADMILSVEPLESLRYEKWLAPQGVVISNMESFVNIPDYPDYESVIADVQKHDNHILIDAKRLARLAGSARSENVTMIGAAAGYLPFEDESYKKYIEQLFSRKGDKVVASNIKAFNLGKAASRFYRKAKDMGYDSAALRSVAQKLVVEDLDDLDGLVETARPLFMDDTGKQFRSLLSDLDGSLTATVNNFKAILGSADTLTAEALKEYCA